MVGREYALKAEIEKVKDDYDYIFIDCPSSLSLLTINAMASADGLIIPIQCVPYAVELLERFLKAIERVKEQFNPKIHIEGIIFILLESDSSVCNEVLIADAKTRLRERVFDTMIPHSIEIVKASSEGKTAFDYDPESARAKSYDRLADEIIKNL